MLRRLSFAALLLLWVQIHLEAAQSGSVQVLVDGKTISAPIIRRGDQASITLSTSFANGSIYYTVDGSEPSVSSTRYSSPFVVRSTSTVKAIAYSLDFSETAFANPVTIQMVGYVNFHYRGGPGILNLDPQPARHDPSDPDHPYPQYVTGTVVRMSFTPARGWILMRWVMNDAETNTAPTIDIVMTNDTWVEIAVGTRATIVQSDHGRIESPYLGTNLVQYQNGLGLKAVPDPGYYLAAWGGDVTGNAINPVSTVLNPNPTVSALFLPQPRLTPLSAHRAIQDGHFGLTITGSIGEKWVLDANRDLNSTSWVSIGMVTLISGTAFVPDTNWTSYQRRYYRLRNGEIYVPPSDYSYSLHNGQVTITKYHGPAGPVAIPDSIEGMPVTSIGDGAFSYHGVSSVAIPSTITNIGSYAFAGCTNLNSVSFPDGILSIGDFAFENLFRVKIPASVVTLGTGAIGGSRLQAIEVEPESLVFSSDVGVLLNKARTIVLQFPASVGGSYTLPLGIETVASHAFAGSSLGQVILPFGVRSIGSWAFAHCEALTNIVAPPTLNSISNNAFISCVELREISLPDSITSIGDSAFALCKNLLTCKFPTNITQIDQAMFSNCLNLRTATFGKITRIGDFAFYLCPQLTSIYFEGDAPNYEPSTFEHTDRVTIFRLPNTMGWGPTFAGRPTAVWDW